MGSIIEDVTSRLSPGRVRKSETSDEDSNSIKDTSNASNARISSVLAGLTDSIGGACVCMGVCACVCACVRAHDDVYYV